MSIAVRPLFVGERDARRFYLHIHPTDHAPRAGLVFVAPWAEEMNKSRRMVALAARAFARRGVSVLIVDLAGTGDSAGEFVDARWDTWLDDIGQAHAWLSQTIHAPVGLWGLRLGALLAATAATQISQTANLLLWQPAVSGKTHLTQFLRLKVAADALTGNAKQNTQHWMDQLAQGHSVEVAGYTLPSALAWPMAAAKLELPAGFAGPVEWIEISQSDPPALLPASAPLLERGREQSTRLHAAALKGPAFWQSQEIEVCAELAAASLRFLEQAP